MSSPFAESPDRPLELWALVLQGDITAAEPLAREAVTLYEQTDAPTFTGTRS
jgi:hypothetical protein